MESCRTISLASISAFEGSHADAISIVRTAIVVIGFFIFYFVFKCLLVKIAMNLFGLSLLSFRQNVMVAKLAHNVWRPDFRAGLKQPTLNLPQNLI
jgi:hypothetical protein